MRIRLQATRSPPCLDAGRRGFAMIGSHTERESTSDIESGGRAASRTLPDDSRGLAGRWHSCTRLSVSGASEARRERQRPEAIAIAAEIAGSVSERRLQRRARAEGIAGNARRPPGRHRDELSAKDRQPRPAPPGIRTKGIRLGHGKKRMIGLPQPVFAVFRNQPCAKRPRPEGPHRRRRRRWRHGSAATMRRALPMARRWRKRAALQERPATPGVTRRAAARTRPRSR